MLLPYSLNRVSLKYSDGKAIKSYFIAKVLFLCFSLITPGWTGSCYGVVVKSVASFNLGSVLREVCKKKSVKAI